MVKKKIQTHLHWLPNNSCLQCQLITTLILTTPQQDTAMQRKEDTTVAIQDMPHITAMATGTQANSETLIIILQDTGTLLQLDPRKYTIQ